MINRTRPIACSLLLVAACGGGGGSPDAGVVVDSQPNLDASEQCAEFAAPAGTISSYPGSFTGDLVGAGADLSAPTGACADERDWFDPVGEDQVVALTGLTGGALYGVILDSAADTSFYVATDCADGEVASGQCVLFVDSTLAGEMAEFTAPDSGSAYLVIDNWDAGPITEGAYTVEVVPAECADDAGCTTAEAPRCYRFECVQCVSGFDCDAAAPACAADNTCVASIDECTGDDAGEPDDGPTDAAALAVPTAGVPTVVDGAICNQPDGEGDWFELVLAADTTLGFTLTWNPASNADLDVIIWDDLGGFVDGGLSTGTGGEAFQVELLAGTYYLQIDQFTPPAVVAATAYQFTALVPECQNSFQCTSPADPVCNAAGACGDGPSECIDDDSADSTGDDGPAAARDLSGTVNTPVSITDGKVCSQPATEGDWYKATTTAAGQGLTLELGWADTTADLDIYVYDGLGRLLGLSYYLNPEVVTLTRLPVGTYYILVTRYSGPPPDEVTPYGITSTRTAADICTTVADCDDTYSTQVFRGQCTAGGACAFIQGAGAIADGATCDSPDDCDSGMCSYIAFEADAAESVCTIGCTTAADCTTLGAGLTCTSGLDSNFCLPTCASNLDCGANVSSFTLDTDQPWDYYTCNTTSGVCTF